ncbi:MAG TPA: MarR family transcriptional regulator [Kribbellaceae bacterium]|nr:MarR family transcriptional regulator [Kribbellaceae bacterium]
MKQPRWSPDAPASAVEILMTLKFAERASRKAIGAELAGSGVHTGQEVVLQKLLLHGSLPVAQLAKVLDVEVPTATRTTQRMEAAGLVRRNRGGAGTDARLVSIELTDQGRVVAEQVQQLQTRAGRRALRGIDAEERKLLRNLLWTIITNLESPD